jgi:hypothetical protein
MRVSIRPNDSGYINHARLRASGNRVLVRLNGELQTTAVTADNEAGVIVRYVQPLEYDRGRECLVDEVVHGRVDIEVIEESVL